MRCLTFPLFPLFLSTLSLRRATCGCCARCLCWVYFYPHSPCGERLHYDNYNLHCVEISIHALLAESDLGHSITLRLVILFLSTLSLRRATRRFRTIQHPQIDISIHALLAESDINGCNPDFEGKLFLSTLSLRRATLNQIPPRRFHYHFYPRSPCGERLNIV